MPVLTDAPRHRCLELGVVVKPHGVRGVLKVHLHNPGSSSLSQPLTVSLVLPSGQRRQVEVRPLGCVSRGSLLLAAEGVEDREQADALRGARIEIPRDQLPPLEEGEYYYSDLTGCQVVDETGELIGQVHQIFEAGASDVLAIRHGAHERYVPLVERWVREVDLAHRRILVVDVDQWEPWRIAGDEGGQEDP